MLSGGAAGATSLAWVYPFDFVRLRMAADVGVCNDTRQFTGMADCFKKTMEAGGVQGLYRGFSLSIAGIVAYRGLYFGLFDTGKSFLFPDPKRANVLSMWMFA